MPVLEEIAEDGALFWYGNEFNRREKRRMKGAFGVLFFVTADFAASERFHAMVDAAVDYGQKILCVYEEEITATPWSTMQLGSQQALYTENYGEALISRLKEAYIFQTMTVTSWQKHFQRNRAVTMVAAPVLAAVVLFFAVINPLLVAPAMEAGNFGKQWGLTKEDMENITELHIVGNQIFDDTVHAIYEGNDRTMVAYDLDVNGSMQRQTSIEAGTLTSDDLSILQYMPNLKILEIEGQQITDISAVFETNVSTLRLNCNPITSIEGIEKMESLDTLVLSYTDITDISPALKLSKLKILQLDGTHVSDLSGVETLHLETLMLADTYVKELPSLGAAENLTLDLRGVSIHDMSCIADVVSFKQLFLDCTDNSMRPQDVMPYLEGKPIESIAWTNLTSLEDIYDLNITDGGNLGIGSNSLSTLDGIEHFEGIKSLDLRAVENVTDLTAILKLENLEHVFISTDMRQLAEEQLQGADFEIEYIDT